MTSTSKKIQEAPRNAPRRGRPPTGSSALTRQAIVLAAVEVVDDEGVDALSLRVVARRLGVDAKSLYNHIDGKDALLDAIAEQVLSRIVIPDLTGNLRADMTAIAHAFRDAALLSHRKAAMLVLSRPVESLVNLGSLDFTLKALLAAGAKPEWAVQAVRTMLAFITGSLLREASTGLTLGVDDPNVSRSRELALSKMDFPHVATAAPYLTRLDHAREFEFGISVLVDAFARQLEG